ncbi:MAG TPA: M91 family zinc metallopeptidase [Pyrinomonadaceae bacterium]|nr:M91 family zinc metallopeptidase [Pyrinomonadaceae bacterium]
MSLSEVGGRIVSAASDALQAGLNVARETLRSAAVTSQPVGDAAARLLTERAVTASGNAGGGAARAAFTPSGFERDVRLARTSASLGHTPAAAQQQQNPAAQGATETVLVQTQEVTIKRQTTPAADPSEPPIERIVFDTGAGDDNVRVTRDPKTGATVITVNGERHTVQLSHDNSTGGGLATVDGKQYQLSRDDPFNLKIRLGDGNDRLEVGSGVRVNLTVEGGAGNDLIRTGAGDDRVEGGEGDDEIRAGAGRDYVNGSRGNDRLYGEAGHDTVYGGDGDDLADGGAGDDYLEGGRGRDHLLGAAGRDVLSGGLDGDLLEGGADDDRLYAGGGRDRIHGGLSTDKKNTARDVAYAQNDDTVAAGTAVVNVELTGTPGSRAIRIVGSPEFVERVEQDIEFLRSSPDGRQMLEAFDQAYDRSRSPLRSLPLVGSLFRDGNTVTIQELTEEDNGFADWSRRTTGGPHPFLDAQGRPGASDNATISYNTRLNQIYDPDPNKASDRWKYFDPVVVLYHEMAHSYNVVTGTFQNGTYNGTGPDGGVIPNSERQAVGLPNSGVLFDNDFDPSTPDSRDNPRALTENGLRAEMNRPARPTYGNS